MTSRWYFVCTKAEWFCDIFFVICCRVYAVGEVGSVASLRALWPARVTDIASDVSDEACLPSRVVGLAEFVSRMMRTESLTDLDLRWRDQINHATMFSSPARRGGVGVVGLELARDVTLDVSCRELGLA